MWFIVYTGDIVKDPLDCGCEHFVQHDKAIKFAKIMENKGYLVELYYGEKQSL